MNQNTLVAAIVSGAICLAIGLGSGTLLTKPNREKTKSIKELQDKEQQLQNKLEEAKLTAERATKAAEQTLKLAKEKAETILKEAEKEAEGYVLLQREEMNKLYPTLRKCQIGTNIVNEKYVKSFILYPRTKSSIGYEYKIKIKMHNPDKYGSISPSVDIHFFDKYGFLVDWTHIDWLLDKIRPGETRYDEKAMHFYHDAKAVYYVIKF